MAPSMEEDDQEVENTARKWTLLGLSAGALLVLVLGIVVIHSKRSASVPLLTHPVRKGNPSFDSYVGQGKVVIANERPLEATNLAGAKFITATGSIINTGDRTITGLELRCYVLDDNAAVALERVCTFIPQLRPQPIPPGGSTTFSVNIGNVAARRKDLSQVKVEIAGLQFEN